MYLSRIELCTQKIDTRRALSSPQIFHAAIESCFNSFTGEKDRKLWRLDRLNGKLYLLILSPAPPNFTSFAAQFCAPGITGETRAYQSLLDRIKPGQRLRFRLRANPVRSVQTERGARGKIFPHVTISQKQSWLMKKAESKGFRVEEGGFEIVETRTVRFYRQGKRNPVELSVAVFEGELTVTDPVQFTQALTQGIGRAKAYGCGLITVLEIG